MTAPGANPFLWRGMQQMLGDKFWPRRAHFRGFHMTAAGDDGLPMVGLSSGSIGFT